VIEARSSEARRRMAVKPIVWLTQFNRTELAHAFCASVFRGRITSIESAQVWKLFEDDCNAGVWILIDLPEPIWQTSGALAQKHGPALGVRTLDSLHVACALELKAQKFWTFDERQARLAEAAGLDTSP
jgi:predicted nucleic acid-binding protein